MDSARCAIALDRPDEFGAAGSMSGAVDPRGCEDEPGIDQVFGDPWRGTRTSGTARRLSNTREAFASAHMALMIDCGTNDSLMHSNRMLRMRGSSSLACRIGMPSAPVAIVVEVLGECSAVPVQFLRRFQTQRQQ